MSDQLNIRMASDFDAGEGIGDSEASSADATLSVHVSKKAKCEPSMILRVLNSALSLKNHGKDEKEFDYLLNGDMSELDHVIKYNIMTHDDFWCSIGYSLLKNAVESGLIDVVQMLLKYADNNTIKALELNFNQLLFACKAGHIEVIRLLLEHGFNPNLMRVDRRDYNETCLAYACSNRKFAMVELLLKHGADPNLFVSDDLPPIFHACASGGIEVVTMLLDYGADINRTGRYGATVLSYLYGNLDLARFLLNHGANVNGVDKEGKTPLMCAVRRSLRYLPHTTGLIQLLLEYGADPSIPDSHGKTALDLVDRGSEIAQLIMNSQIECVLK